MSVESLTGSLVVVGGNTELPSIFWKGQKLEEVLGVKMIVDSDEQQVVLKVMRTSNFDDVYQEMADAGVVIKKRRAV